MPLTRRSCHQQVERTNLAAKLRFPVSYSRSTFGQQLGDVRRSRDSVRAIKVPAENRQRQLCPINRQAYVTTTRHSMGRFKCSERHSTATRKDICDAKSLSISDAIQWA